MHTILVTGASGLLGRAIVAALQAVGGLNVVGVTFSRAVPGGVTCDLRSAEAVDKLLDEVKPHAVVHAAAERRPNVCESDEAGSELINGLCAPRDYCV